MSSTDQAFIKAYSTDEQPVAPIARESVSHARERSVRGPHADFAGGQKRPLSEALAARGEHQAGEGQRAIAAGTTVASFLWPRVVAHLTDKCNEAYRRMLAYASRSGGVVGFLGCAPGVGCTTTVMACGLSAARAGTPIALVDADPTVAALSQSLGFLHARSIAEALSATGAPSDAVIHSAGDNTSLAVAFPDRDYPPSQSVTDALRGLMSNHAAVLVDLGSDAEALALNPSRGAHSLGLDAVILVRRSGVSEAELTAARQALAAAGHTVVGVVDSFAAA